MTTPTVHLNGTGRQGLEDQYREVGDALRAVFDALRLMAPHERDYYPQGPEAYTKARAEHRARTLKILEVQDEIIQLHEALVKS